MDQKKVFEELDSAFGKTNVEEEIAKIIFNCIDNDEFQIIDLILNNEKYKFFINWKLVLRHFFTSNESYEKNNKKLCTFFNLRERLLYQIYVKTYLPELKYLLNLVYSPDFTNNILIDIIPTQENLEILFNSRYMNETIKNKLIEKHIGNDSKYDYIPLVDYLAKENYDFSLILHNQMGVDKYLYIIRKLKSWHLNSNYKGSLCMVANKNFTDYRGELTYDQNDEWDFKFISASIKYSKIIWFKFFLPTIKLTDEIINVIFESKKLYFILEICDRVLVTHPAVVKFLSIQGNEKLSKLFIQVTELPISVAGNDIELIKKYLEENKHNDDVLISKYLECKNLHSSKQIKMLFFEAVKDQKRFFEIC